MKSLNLWTFSIAIGCVFFSSAAVRIASAQVETPLPTICDAPTGADLQPSQIVGLAHSTLSFRPRRVCVLNNAVLFEDTRIFADVVIIRGNVTTSGNLFSIAANTLEFRPGSQIRAFSEPVSTVIPQAAPGASGKIGQPGDEDNHPDGWPGADGQNGSPGADGADATPIRPRIYVSAVHVHGEMRINGNGQQGGQGGQGGNGGGGGQGGPGAAAHFGLRCYQGGRGGDGGFNANGGPGGIGGLGGPGAEIVLRIGDGSRQNPNWVTAQSGAGGIGGDGGERGEGGRQGIPGPDARRLGVEHCPGGGEGLTRDPGGRGAQGLTGRSGRAGSIDSRHSGLAGHLNRITRLNLAWYSLAQSGLVQLQNVKQLMERFPALQQYRGAAYQTDAIFRGSPVFVELAPIAQELYRVFIETDRAATSHPELVEPWRFGRNGVQNIHPTQITAAQAVILESAHSLAPWWSRSLRWYQNWYATGNLRAPFGSLDSLIAEGSVQVAWQRSQAIENCRQLTATLAHGRFSEELRELLRIPGCESLDRLSEPFNQFLFAAPETATQTEEEE